MVSKIFSNNISQFNVSTFQTSQITFVNPRIQNFFQITFAIPQLLNFSQFHLLVNGFHTVPKNQCCRGAGAGGAETF